MRINQATPQIPPGPPAMPAPIDKESPLWKAAQGMEEQFMKEMLRNMRKTVDESPEEKADQGLQVFRGMLDDHYAESAVRTQGIGLAQLIVNQMLERDRPVQMNPQVREVNKNDIAQK